MATQVALSWTAPSGATTYNVYRGTSTGGESSTPIQINIHGTTFEDANPPSNTSSNNSAGLAYGTTYFYKITAVNSGGESAKSSEVHVTTQPDAVTSFTCTPGDSKVTLSWSALPGATGYHIYRDTLGGVGGAANLTTTGTSFIDSGLVNGTTYYYSIAAFNADGENGNTGQTNSATPTGTSGVLGGLPTNLRATPGNAQVVLTWNPVSNATKYNISRAFGSNGATPLASVNAPTVTYTDKNLTNGTVYSYTVQAANPSSTGALTSAVTATPLVPGAPTSLTATAEPGQVVLTWTATGTSYAIYRGTAPGTETLLDMGLTGNSFIDAGVSNGVPYYYQIQALNTGGTGPMSAEVTATPNGTTPSGTPPNGWINFVTFNLPGEPVQSILCSIPDINRPIRAAVLTVEGNNMQNVANKYNALMVGIDGFTGYSFGLDSSQQNISLSTPFDTSHGICVLDYRWPVLGAQRIQAALNAVVSAVAAQFPTQPHPEIANVGLVLYGFSTGEDNVNLAAAQPSLVNRVLAVVHLSEIDEDRYNPLATLDTAPHLFLASGQGSIVNGQPQGDPFSNLVLGVEDFPSVTHDTEARGLATNQGAPFTVIDNAGAGHGDNADHPFVSIWLDSVLSQRLPATVPMIAPVNLPSWQNTASSWVGTYTLQSNVTTSPWGQSGNPGVQLINNAVTTKGAYTDSRPFTWLPSANAAQAWLTYANTGALNSLIPVLIGQATASGTAGQPFYYQITATNLPTSYSASYPNHSSLPFGLQFNSATGVISSTSGTGLTGSGSATILIGASNVEGSTSTTSGNTLTITVNQQSTVTFGQWATNNGITADPSATPLNDGVPNLFKYVFDINPKNTMSASDRAALPTVSTDTTTKPGTTYLTLTYRTNPTVTNVNIAAQISPDMTNWGPPVPVNQLPLFQQTPIAGSSDLTTKVGVNVTGQSAAFMRLQITQTP